MQRYGWLVWTKERTWRFYMPHTDRAPDRKQLTLGSTRIPVPITHQTIQPGEFGFPVHLRTSGDGSWHLPPLIGIITSKHHQQPSFRGNRANFRDIIETGRRMGVLVFVFIPEGFHKTSPYTVGYSRHPAHKQWIRLVFPHPDVVYNRIPDRESEQRSPERQALRFFLSSPHIHMFNPHFFDKQELFRWLANDRVLRSCLPATAAWGPTGSKEKLIHYVRHYDTVYIKPTRGKAGKGIMRIKKDTDHYHLTYVTGKASELIQFRTRQIKTLYLKINHLVNGQPYMIQQGVSLSRYQGRPFDCRLLVQKNGHGRWGVTGLGIRVAGARGITTHVPRGGTIGKPADIFPRVFGSRAKSVYEQATELAVAVARGIERQSGKKWGEVSIDLGIDRNLNMWVFEANAKPMKFDEPLIRKRSLERLIAYATYLTEGREPSIDHP